MNNVIIWEPLVTDRHHFQITTSCLMEVEFQGQKIVDTCSQDQANLPVTIWPFA